MFQSILMFHFNVFKIIKNFYSIYKIMEIKFLLDLNQLIDLIKKELNEIFIIGKLSESGDIDIVLKNMKYDFNFNMNLLNFINKNLPNNIKFAYLTCGNNKLILDDIKNNKIKETNYSKFQNKLLKKFKKRSKMRQLWYQSKFSLLRYNYDELTSKINSIKSNFKEESTFILNLVGINSETDFTPLQFVIYSKNKETFYNNFNRDDELDSLLWKYFNPVKNYNFWYYAEMRLHYLKYFKSESHEKWLFNKINSDIFKFKKPKVVDIDVYDKMIYLIQKKRKKKYYLEVISSKSSYDFDNEFSSDNKLTSYFEGNINEIRYFYFFKVYLLNLLGYKLSNSRLAQIFKKHILRTNKIPAKIKKLTDKEIIYLLKIVKNPYFTTYFNNVTWQALPLPWDNIGNILIATYTNKRSNLGFIKDKFSVDKFSKRKYYKNYDTKIEKELLTNLNILKFKSKIYSSDSEYLVLGNNYFYICENVEVLFEYPYESKILFMKCKYRKNFYKNKKIYIPLEDDMIWENFKENVKVNFKDLSYLLVMNKLSKEDLYKIFMKDKLESNIKIYHNTQIKGIRKDYEKLLYQPTFFAFSKKYDSKYFIEGSKCITYGVINKVDNLLLLGLNISKLNNFNSNIDENKLNKSVIFDKNDKYFKYLDLGSNKQYEGRRKLQELIFGSRQFVPSEIYGYENYKQKVYDINHPLIKRTPMSYDAIFLKRIGINGFIADDFKFALETDGELLLTNPNEYVKILDIKEYKCSLDI